MSGPGSQASKTTVPSGQHARRLEAESRLDTERGNSRVGLEGAPSFAGARRPLLHMRVCSQLVMSH